MCSLNCYICFYINITLYLPDLENLIKHSCNHGLLLLMAKARLTDCNINRNFPVCQKKKIKQDQYLCMMFYSLYFSLT